MTLEQIKTEENKVELRNIGCEQLKDFLGWTLIASEDINIIEEDIKFYQKRINPDKVGNLLVIKDHHFYAETTFPDMIGDKIMEVIATSKIRDICNS